jgi:L-ascorbate metabolism protein UlaG (beta-lactamase superfamily)
MGIRLSRKLFETRDIQLGYGVSFTFKPFGYSQYKEAEARAGRMARARLDQMKAVQLESADDEDLGPEFHEHLSGLAAEILLDSIVTTYATGWNGVFDEKVEEDGPDVPLPLNAQTWEMFRKELPLLADILDRKLVMPMHIVVTEGNVSALSLTGGTPVG